MMIESEGQTMAPATTATSKGKASSVEIFAGVRLTHPDRLVFPDEKITKRDLAVYYTAVAPYCCLTSRAVRFPWCVVLTDRRRRVSIRNTSGKSCRNRCGIPIKEKAGNAIYIAVDDLAGLISLVQMGVLEIHPWGSREDRIDRPDRLIFDIDPAVDLNWKMSSWQLATSGSVSTTWGLSVSCGRQVAKVYMWSYHSPGAHRGKNSKPSPSHSPMPLFVEQPKRYIAQSSKAKRAGKLYLDYLRNERGATAIASYSTRARPGATVATPLSWDELSASLRPAQFNVRNRARAAPDDDARSVERLFRFAASDHKGNADEACKVARLSGGRSRPIAGRALRTATAWADVHGFTMDPSKTPDTVLEPDSPGTIVSRS